AAPTRVGIINIQAAILSTNEGKRDFGTLQKKYEPKQSDLTKENETIEDLKKQRNAQEGKLNDETRNQQVKQIETRTGELQHNAVPRGRPFRLGGFRCASKKQIPRRARNDNFEARTILRVMRFSPCRREGRFFHRFVEKLVDCEYRNAVRGLKFSYLQTMLHL